MNDIPYDKLVRDRIPEIVIADGKRPVTHIADGNEYRRKLLEKLGEEAAETAENPSIGELADVLEVVHALGALLGLTPAEVEAERLRKRGARGGFERRIILEKVVG